MDIKGIDMSTTEVGQSRANPTQEIAAEDKQSHCNFMTRKNTFCKVPVNKDNPCGYHDSVVQKTQEYNLNQTILSLLNDRLDTDLTLQDLDLTDQSPAHDLIELIISQVQPDYFISQNCEHNWVGRIDGMIVCTLCQAVKY